MSYEMVSVSPGESEVFVIRIRKAERTGAANPAHIYLGFKAMRCNVLTNQAGASLLYMQITYRISPAVAL